MALSDKENFRAENIKSNKDDHFTMIKGSIYQKDITILNLLTQFKINEAKAKKINR